MVAKKHCRVLPFQIGGTSGSMSCANLRKDHGTSIANWSYCLCARKLLVSHSSRQLLKLRRFRADPNPDATFWLPLLPGSHCCLLMGLGYRQVVYLDLRFFLCHYLLLANVTVEHAQCACRCTEGCFHVLKTETVMVPPDGLDKHVRFFSTDTMQNDDRFDKDSKFVAVCFHKFCVIYFVYIVFDTKAKKQEGTGGGCASIFHVIIFNTKTILFANTDGDQWKSWIMSMRELVVSFSGCATDLWTHFWFFSFLENAGRFFAPLAVVLGHTIPYQVATACPLSGTGTAGGTVCPRFVCPKIQKKVDGNKYDFITM